MTSSYPYYQPTVPVDNTPRTPDGEEILLGPYNAQQAPYLECGSCGTPITIGQRVTVMREYLVGITRSGRIQLVSVPDFEEEAYVHSDCSAEFAHDQITKEPCGKNEEFDTCEFCDQPIPEGYRCCAACAHKFGVQE
jgi:DNA-directed RNA polymerase subunit RPC12/RpoP